MDRQGLRRDRPGRRTAGIGLLLAALVLASCAPGEEAAPEVPTEEAEGEAAEQDDPAYDPIEITWPTGLPEDIWIMGGLRGFEEALAETSDGLITLDVHMGDALGPLTDHGPLLRDGIADITWVMSPLELGQYPADQWIAALAWMFENRPLVGDLQAYASTLEWGFTDPLQEQMLEQGMVPLVPSTSGLANYTHLCNDPAGSLDQARGQEARVTSEIHGNEAEAVGMTPTFIEAAETYEALQRGVIDCVLMHPRDLAGFNLLDIAEHVHMDPDAAFSGHMAVGLYANQDWWDGLPLAAQQDIWDALRGYVHEQMRLSLEMDIDFFEDVAERGQLHELSDDFIAALTEHQEGELDRLRSNPPEGWSEDEANAALDGFLDGVERWLAVGEELGYADAPETWEEYVETYPVDEIDLEPWVDRVWEELFAPHRPS